MFPSVPGNVPAMEKGQWAVGYTLKGQNMEDLRTLSQYAVHYTHTNTTETIHLKTGSCRRYHS